MIGQIIEIAFLIAIIIIIIAYLMSYIIYKDLKSTANEANISGCEIARIVCTKLKNKDIHIIKKKGLFLDYYDDNRQVIKLSPEVFDGTNMYSSLIAFRLALETNNQKDQIINEKFCYFLVIASYIMICLGAFLNNPNIIHFGFVLFIIAFLLEMFCINFYIKEDEMTNIIKLIKKEHLILPLNDLENNLIVVSIVHLARLPYGFINHFR